MSRGSPSSGFPDSKRGLHHADVIRSGSATSSNDAHPGGDKLARIARHVLGRAEIDVSAFHRTRNACVGLGGERKGSDGSHALDGVQHGHWTHTAIAADDVGTPILESRSKCFWIGTIQAVAIFIDRNLHD